MHLASDLLEGGHRMLGKWHQRRKSRADSKRQHELLLEVERARRSGAPSPEPQWPGPAAPLDDHTFLFPDSDFLSPTDAKDQTRKLEHGEQEQNLMVKSQGKHGKDTERWSGSTYKPEAWQPESQRSEDAVATTDKTNETETETGTETERTEAQARSSQQQPRKPPPRLVLFCPHCMGNSNQSSCQRAKQHYQQQQLHHHHHHHHCH